MAQRISRQRLDKELVRQGFFKDTQAALRAILAGDVSTRDRRLTSAGELVPEGIVFCTVKGAIPYVSRGGLKLERAFEVFDFTVQNKKMSRYWLFNWRFYRLPASTWSCFGYLG